MLTSKKIAVLLLSASISLGAFEAQAAKNLVGATLTNKTGVDAGFTAALDSQLRIGKAYPVAYRLTNNVGIDIQGFAVKPVISGPAKFDVVSNDCPAVLPVGASCDFTGKVTATSAGEVTLQINLVEGGNTFLLHKDVATAILQAPNLVASSTLAPQYFANKNTGGEVTFTFKNTGVDTAVVSSVNITNPAVSGASVPLLSQIRNNCAGATIASGASCMIIGKLTTGTAATTYNLAFDFNYHEASSGSEVLKAGFNFPVTVLEPSTLAVISAPSKLVAYPGETTQGIVTLENTGTGTIVDIKATLDTDNNGTLALVKSSTTPCEGTLNENQSCEEAVDFTATKQDSVNGNPSYVPVLATLTVSYQDGKGGKPLQQSVLAVQVDNGYFINVPADLPGIKNQLPSNVINAMTFANNTLYVGTPNGLSMSKDHGTTWVDSTALNGLPSNDVTAVFADSKSVFVATDSGIAVSNDGGFYFEALKNWTTAYGVPQAIAQTSDNTVYVGTTTGLYSNAGGTFAQVVGNVPAGVTAVSVDNSDNVYAIANHNLYSNNSGSFEQIISGSSCTVNGMNTSVGNLATKLLVASSCGLLSYNGSALTSVVTSEPIVTIVATWGGIYYGISATDSGNMLSWNNATGKEFSLISNDTHLTSASLVALDSDGVHIYVGSSTGGGFSVGTIVTNNASMVTFKPQISALTNASQVSSILPLADNVYVGTNTGLYNLGLNGSGNVLLSGTAINGLAADSAGHLYVATNSGLQSSDDGVTFNPFGNSTPYSAVSVDGDNFYAINAAPGFADSVFYGSLDGSTGAIQNLSPIARTKALVLSAMSGEYYTVSNGGLYGIPAGQPYDSTSTFLVGGMGTPVNLFADANGNVYSSISTGLNIWNGSSLSTVTLPEPGQVAVYNGVVYVATNRGVYAVTGLTATKISTIIPQASSLGVASLAMNANALYIVSNGQLLMTHVSPAN